MAGNFNVIGYLSSDYGTQNRWINSGGRSIKVAVNNDQIKITMEFFNINGQACIPVTRPYECYIKSGESFYTYIYAAKADQFYEIHPEDDYPTHYEPFKIYKRWWILYYDKLFKNKLKRKEA